MSTYAITKLTSGFSIDKDGDTRTFSGYGATVERVGLLARIAVQDNLGQPCDLNLTSDTITVNGTPFTGTIAEFGTLLGNSVFSAGGGAGEGARELGTHTENGTGVVGQVVSIPVTTINPTMAVAIPMNAEAINAGIQSQVLSGTNLEVTLVQATNGASLIYTYLAK